MDNPLITKEGEKVKIFLTTDAFSVTVSGVVGSWYNTINNQVVYTILNPAVEYLEFKWDKLEIKEEYDDNKDRLGTRIFLTEVTK